MEDQILITEEAAPPRIPQGVRTAGWIGFAVVCMLAFTLLKLPEDRVRNYVQAMISQALASKGITVTAGESHVSLGFGISYVMNDVTLNFPLPEAPVHVEKVAFSPSLAAMIFGKMGGTLWVDNAGGSLKASFKAKEMNFSTKFKLSDLDLGKLGVLPIAAGFKGGGVASGSGSLSGDLAVASTLSGDLDLRLSKVVIDAQSIQGFSIPKLSISEAVVKLTADKGKATIQELRIGKTGSAADDIHATATGDLSLARQFEASTLNLKVKFSFSE
ncbi:MAG: type II secretion system protein GspN, partial [Bdellovibrionota bacterium]